MNGDPSRQVCPYPGLMPFARSQAAFFFGREREVSELQTRLDNHPSVLVVSPSGTGKTSLIQAGLLPALQQGKPQSEKYRSYQSIGMRPGSSPFRAFASALLTHSLGSRWSECSRSGILAEVDALADFLKCGGTEALQSVLCGEHELECRFERMVIVVEQWEEVYSGRETIAGPAHKFMDALLATAQHLPQLRVVLALRAEFWADFMVQPPSRDLLPDAAVLHLRPLDKDALTSAIEEPIRKVGLEIERALVRQLIADATECSDHLPLLQMALRELWNSARCAESHTLSLRNYERLGGIEGVLDHSVEEFMANLDDVQKPELGNLLAELIPRSGKALERPQPVVLDSLAAPRRKLADRLVDAGLLELHSACAGADAWVELAGTTPLRHCEVLRSLHSKRRSALQAAGALEAEATRAANCDGHFRCHEKMLDHRQAAMLSEVLPGLPRDRKITPAANAYLGPIDKEKILRDIQNPDTSHRRRSFLGERLSVLGDSRPGVGCRGGVPDIVWLDVAGSRVLIQGKRLTLPWSSKRVWRISAFRIARYPITAIQYQAFVEAEDGWANSQWWANDLLRDPDGDQVNFGRFSNYPAQYVNWFDAMAFCRWLTATLRQKGDLPESSTVRLPNEWEWQQAADGGDPEQVYPWGSGGNSELPAYRANTLESRLGHATAVGMYPLGASAVGGLDMAGNVFEWCLNKYEAPTVESSKVTDLDRRSVRGGSWFVPQVEARCRRRRFDRPSDRFVDVGFRVMCTVA